MLALVGRISPTEHSLSLQTMNKNTLILLFGVFIAGALSASAQTSPAATPPAPSFSFVVTPAFVSQYMFRGVRLGGPSFEPNVEFDTGNLGLGVWANFPMQDKVPGQSDPEIDPYGYYTFAINDSLSIVPGFTWYNYPHADKGAGFYKSTFEPNIALNYTFAGVKLTPKLYYDLVLDGPTAELAVAYTVPLKEIGSELDFVGTGGAYKWKKLRREHDTQDQKLGRLLVARSFASVRRDQRVEAHRWLGLHGRPRQFSETGTLAQGRQSRRDWPAACSP